MTLNALAGLSLATLMICPMIFNALHFGGLFN
jgi:hypothetical protein